jgi:hypothetical protein
MELTMCNFSDDDSLIGLITSIIALFAAALRVVAAWLSGRRGK